VSDFAQAVEEWGESGYLFQPRIVPHPDWQAVIGDRVSTVRLLVFVTPGGPEIYRALTKIPAGSNVADNFWRAGNMLAAIDAESGRIQRVVTGTGTTHATCNSHPDTGAALIGFQIPCWQSMRELCLAAAAALSAVRLQAWDIAVSKDGPLIVEANIGGDFNLVQLAFGKGIFDSRFKEHIASCGYRL
jgi:hypothetical protein